MFPTHPETVGSLSAFDYQQRLKEAAKDRIAARAQTPGASSLTSPTSGYWTVAAWIGGLLRLQSANRVRPSRPLASG